MISIGICFKLFLNRYNNENIVLDTFFEKKAIYNYTVYKICVDDNHNRICYLNVLPTVSFLCVLNEINDRIGT